MKRPWTAQPCSLSKRAVTAESTPPESPTTIEVADLADRVIRPPQAWRRRSANRGAPPNPGDASCRPHSPLYSAGPAGCEVAARVPGDPHGTANGYGQFRGLVAEQPGGHRRSHKKRSASWLLRSRGFATG